MKLFKTTAARLITFLAVIGGLILIGQIVFPEQAAWFYALIDAGYSRR